MPELGAGIEVIDTATPKLYNTRASWAVGGLGRAWMFPGALNAHALFPISPRRRYDLSTAPVSQGEPRRATGRNEIPLR